MKRHPQALAKVTGLEQDENIKKPGAIMNGQPRATNTNVYFVQQRRRNEEAYQARMGGQVSCRITVPLTNLDDIRAAAMELRALADVLDDTAALPLDAPARLLTARVQVYQAHRTLKRRHPNLRDGGG